MQSAAPFHLEEKSLNCSLQVCGLTEEEVTRSTLIRLPPQELVGTFPRGEGKALYHFVV